MRYKSPRCITIIKRFVLNNLLFRLAYFWVCMPTCYSLSKRLLKQRLLGDCCCNSLSKICFRSEISRPGLLEIHCVKIKIMKKIFWFTDVKSTFNIFRRRYKILGKIILFQFPLKTVMVQIVHKNLYIFHFYNTVKMEVCVFKHQQYCISYSNLQTGYVHVLPLVRQYICHSCNVYT
jgi:hypothetical protein